MSVFSLKWGKNKDWGLESLCVAIQDGFVDWS